MAITCIYIYTYTLYLHALLQPLSGHRTGTIKATLKRRERHDGGRCRSTYSFYSSGPNSRRTSLLLSPSGRHRAEPVPMCQRWVWGVGG